MFIYSLDQTGVVSLCKLMQNLQYILILHSAAIKALCSRTLDNKSHVLIGFCQIIDMIRHLINQNLMQFLINQNLMQFLN